LSEEGVWEALGVLPTTDAGEIRRAYAARLKATRPEDDPAAFQRLRGAYEWALQLASRGSAEPQEFERVSEASADASANSASATPLDPALVTFNAALSELRARLFDDSPPDANELIRCHEAVLMSPILQQLTCLHEVELELAHLLVAAGDRADPLLEPAVARFDWRGRAADIATPPNVLAILERCTELEILHSLRTNLSHEGSRAYHRLRQPVSKWARWWRAHRLPLEESHEVELIQFMQSRHPRLLSEFDPKVVDWWLGFATRPRLSNAFLHTGMFLVPTALVVGAIAGATDGKPVQVGLLAACGALLVMALLMAAKMFLIDWPTNLAARRWGPEPPLGIQCGWFAVLITLLLLAPWLPDNLYVTAIVAVVGVACCLWGVYVAGPRGSFVHHKAVHIQNSHIALILFFNGLLAIWALAAMPSPSGAALNPASAAALTAMAGGVIGLQILGGIWFERLAGIVRALLTTALALAAVALAVLSWRADRTPDALSAWLAAWIVLVVTLHRIPRQILGGTVYQVGIYTTIGLGIAIPFLHPSSGAGDGIAALNWGGPVFSLAVLPALVAAAFSEFKREWQVRR
jgi:hypothetical protein